MKFLKRLTVIVYACLLGMSSAYAIIVAPVNSGSPIGEATVFSIEGGGPLEIEDIKSFDPLQHLQRLNKQ